MPFLVLYLIKSSISLCVVWMFYQLLLRPLTFYSWNRWYLMGYSLLCFLIPFIDVHRIVDDNPMAEPIVIRYIPVIRNYTPVITAVRPKVATSAGPSVWFWLIILLIAGAVILLCRLLVRWLSLRKVRRDALLVSDAKDKVRIYQVNRPIVPFSFGNAVYINQHLHTEKEWEEIILHEFVHIRQRHTVDILIAELICAFNWYNPFAWLIRFSIRQNLEFIADRQVLDNGVDKKGYQYHLVKVISQPAYRLANNFNFSSLKKRITMMNKIKSARLHLVRFLFVLPLLATLLVAFRGQYEGFLQKHSGQAYMNIAGIISDFNTYEPIPGVLLLDKQSGISTTTDERGFFRMQIPAVHDSVWVRLAMSRADYDSGTINIFDHKLTQPKGHIEIDCLHRTNTEYKYGVFMGYMNYPLPPLEPSYQDALKAFQKVRQENVEMNNYFMMQKQHPEVSLFYTAEDHEKQIVFYQDGHYEKYGYPGGPTVADMEAKFGKMPGLFTGKQGSAGGYYVQQWAKISAQAEKEFHSSNPNARHIVFPGDSRVIVVPMSGRPQIYDMDNDQDDKERPAFEREYGKLPDCVPQPGTPQPGTPQSGKPQPGTPQPGNQTSSRVVTDSVLLTGTSTHADTVPPPPLIHADARWNDLAHPQPAFVLDGKLTNGLDIRGINPNDIYAISVLKSNPDSLARIYGEQARNGVVLITTKAHAPAPEDILSHRARVVSAQSEFVGPIHITWTGDPLSGLIVRADKNSKYIYMIDGKVVPNGTDLGKILHLDDLAGIETSKGSGLVQRFGGRQGQMIMNAITLPNKNDKASYILTYQMDSSVK